MQLCDARILVVDDEVALREMFAKWLRASGCKDVRVAGNGLEAIHAIEQAQIDVLISDVRMPVMDGITLVRQLAGRDERVSCIIFVSAFGDVDSREMYDLGVEAFLAKPFRLEELAAVLDRAIAERTELWDKPFEIAPRQTAHFECAAPHVQADGESVSADKPACFRLGRGGFSTQSPAQMGTGKIAFVCSFPGSHGDPPDLTGQGYVRWRSRTEHTVGIEFAYLDPPGREWVANEIARTNPRGFIPAL